MEGVSRRKKLLEILKEEKEPVSGSNLAMKLKVSRQVIVQDIALLRAVNKNILSTTKGYILYEQAAGRSNRCFLVKHTTEQIGDELNTIIDYGGKVLNVIVMHEIYGQIQADLMLATRVEVKEFVEKVHKGGSVPLKELTDGVHLHTVEADSEETLDKIEQKLREKKYLLS